MGMSGWSVVGWSIWGEVGALVSLPDLRIGICEDIGLGLGLSADEQNVALLLHQILVSGSFYSAEMADCVTLSAFWRTACRLCTNASTDEC